MPRNRDKNPATPAPGGDWPPGINGEQVNNAAHAIPCLENASALTGTPSLQLFQPNPTFLPSLSRPAALLTPEACLFIADGTFVSFLKQAFLFVFSTLLCIVISFSLLPNFNTVSQPMLSGFPVQCFW